MTDCEPGCNSDFEGESSGNLAAVRCRGQVRRDWRGAWPAQRQKLARRSDGRNVKQGERESVSLRARTDSERFEEEDGHGSRTGGGRVIVKETHGSRESTCDRSRGLDEACSLPEELPKFLFRRHVSMSSMNHDLKTYRSPNFVSFLALPFSKDRDQFGRVRVTKSICFLEATDGVS